MSHIGDLHDIIEEKNSHIEKLRLGLRAVRAMLNQPVQYTDDTKDADQLRRRVQILRDDCEVARSFIYTLLK